LQAAQQYQARVRVTGCYLPRDRLAEPPFSASGAERASGPSAGLASQIFSFTSAICSLIAANPASRPTSCRTFSTSLAASCRPTVPRPRTLLVHKNLGP
jgi:hypothetical protein